MRQNYWTLGASGARCCRVVGHHTIEDQMTFPESRSRGGVALGRGGAAGEEHEVIAAAIDLLEPLGRREVVA
jgi:hypothetical protein